MIQTVITHHCTRCNSINIVKNGTDYKGNQKFHCLDCGAYGTLEPQSRSYPEVFKELVLRAYRERASMRGVERIFGIARRTLARWLLEKAGVLPDLVDTLETAEADDLLELDELWSFVFRKSDKRCADPMKQDTFEAVFSEHREAVHVHAAIVPRTRPA